MRQLVRRSVRKLRWHCYRFYQCYLQTALSTLVLRAVVRWPFPLLTVGVAEGTEESLIAMPLKPASLSHIGAGRSYWHRLGYCADCDRTVELTPVDECLYCGGRSIMVRGAKTGSLDRRDSVCYDGTLSTDGGGNGDGKQKAGSKGGRRRRPHPSRRDGGVRAR